MSAVAVVTNRELLHKIADEYADCERQRAALADEVSHFQSRAEEAEERMEAERVAGELDVREQAINWLEDVRMGLRDVPEVLGRLKYAQADQKEN